MRTPQDGDGSTFDAQRRRRQLRLLLAITGGFLVLFVARRLLPKSITSLGEVVALFRTLATALALGGATGFLLLFVRRPEVAATPAADTRAELDRHAEDVGRTLQRLVREAEWSRKRANAALWIGVANAVIGLVLLYLIASR